MYTHTHILVLTSIACSTSSEGMASLTISSPFSPWKYTACWEITSTTPSCAAYITVEYTVEITVDIEGQAGIVRGIVMVVVWS